MLITIYYPTLQIPNKTIPYIDAISASFFETTIGIPNGSLSHLTTQLQWQAPTLIDTGPQFSNSSSPYPTLIFAPGAGLPAVAYTAYLSELASYGHAVIAIDHPGEAPYLPLPFTHPPQGVYGYPDFTNFPTTLEDAFAVQTYRESDISALVSDMYLPSLVRRFGAPFNLSCMGVFGHSIGGSAAGIVMGSAIPEAKKFKAGANLDGTIFPFLNQTDGMSLNTSAVAVDIKRPFLELGSQMHFDGDPNADLTFAPFNDAQTGWLREVQMNGTRHLDYSDIPLWLELLDLPNVINNRTWAGPLDGVRAVSLTNSLLREFFGNAFGSGLERVDEWIDAAPELFLMRENESS